MNTLELYSERYSPTGNVTSEGVLNQLGRPKLDMLAVLIREAVQNSWDARLPDVSSIRFGAAGWILSAPQRELLKNAVFPQRPSDLNLGNLLNSPQDLHVLALYDRGTEGLGGPTRADQMPAKNEPNNFVDFLRNVGQPPDKHLAGGTYGYGKAVLYRVSEAHTILVHTRCLSNGKLQSRFMGAALGSPFADKQQRFTGRHWWGRTENNVIEPILNRESEWLAVNLGFPRFQDHERGTTIVIVQPMWGERTPQQALQLMVEYLLWYFWPKMLETDSGAAPIQFEVSWQGEPMHIPHPADFPPLEGFVQAMRRLKMPADQQTAGSGEVYEIKTKQYNQYLGKLALERFPVNERSARIGEETSPISNTSHHVALMRQPELVVRYLEGLELPSSLIEYAGVFITDEAVDKVFADAEPPTHDDWVSNFVDERREKVFINSALREIRKRMDEFVRPPATQTAPGELTPLGAFANQLGALLPGQSGNAAFSNLFARRRSIKSGYAAEVFAANSSSVSPAVPTRHESPSSSEVVRSSDGVSGHVPGSSYTVGDPNASIRSTAGRSEGLTTPGSLPPFNNPVSHENMRSVFDRTEPQMNSDTSDGKNSQPTLPRRPGKVRITRLEEGELLVLDDGSPALRFEFELQFLGDPCTAAVSVVAGALLDGDEIETEPPEGSEVPQILYWEDAEGSRWQETSILAVQSSLGGTWFVVVSVPDDVMIGIELTAELQSEGIE